MRVTNEPGLSGSAKPPDMRCPTLPADLAAFLAWEDAPPPEWLRDAVEVAIADFPIEPASVSYGTRADGTPVVRFPSSTWFLSGRVERGAALRVAVADFLQEQEFDGQSSEPWGKAWPECPGHPHPPEPRVIDDEAVWICPRDDRRLAPIGRLLGG